MRVVRVVVALALVLLGLVVGATSVLVHATAWGLPLAAAAVAAVTWALPAGWSTRVAFAAGFGGVVLLLTNPRPEGDYLISADLRGYLVLGLALVLVVAAVVSLPRRGGGARPLS